MEQNKTTITVKVADPDITVDDVNEVVNWLSRKEISGISEPVKLFEKAFAKSHDCKYGVATGSGTTALHLALASLGIKAGDEVIVPDFTMIACPNAVSYLGAKPVFVDADPATWCIDVSKIEEKITPRTKAILAVHIYGHPCDVVSLLEICLAHKLMLIEDCAEAHGAEYNDQRVGCFGDAAIFSFYANKIVTMGEGGILITNNEKVAESAHWLRAHAFGKGGKHFWHERLGYGYRVSGLQCALGLSQLRRLGFYVNRHRQNARLYMQLLRTLQLSGKIVYPVEKHGCKNVYWMFSILINEKQFGMSRDQIMAQLAKDGIETRTMFYPMHVQPPYLEKNGKYPVADDLSKRGMNLPSGNTLSPQMVAYVCDCLRSCAGETDAIKRKEEWMQKQNPFTPKAEKEYARKRMKELDEEEKGETEK